MAPKPAIVVTGSAGGIGSETVRILLEECNAQVVATDIVEGSLKSLKEKHGDNLHIVLGDVIEPATSARAVQLAVEHFGKLDGLCLLAGVFGPCYRLDNSDMNALTKAMQINVLSHVHTLRYALPELRKTKGRIVAATSGAGNSALFGGWGFYGMSKAAVSFEMKQIALEEPDVTAIGISPGLCNTPMISALRSGNYAGQTEKDVADYNSFVGKVDFITPTTAGRAYALTVTAARSELSGETVDYNDSRLPIPEEDKAKNVAKGTIDYSIYTKGSSKA